MKKFFIAWTFSLLQLFVYGQNAKSIDAEKTKIYIVGVVHSENQFRNTDSLLIILKDIKPDLILSETDTLSGYFKSDYTLVEPPKWYKMARKLKAGRKMPPEMEILYIYLNYDSSIKIFPFDIAILNRKDDVVLNNSKEKEWVEMVNKGYSENKITSALLPLFDLCLKYNNYYVSMLSKSYSELNKKVVSDSIRSFMALEKELNSKLIENIPELGIYNDWLTQNYANWVQRNEAMAKNIIRFSEMVKAKRVVVFTGILHKYYLIDLLNSHNNEQRFELIEQYFKN